MRLRSTISQKRVPAVVVLGLLAVAVHAFVAPPAAADPAVAAQSDDEPVVVRYFYGDGCPYCAEQAVALDAWESELDVEIHRYEVWGDADNRELYARLAAAHGVEALGVPATFIGPWVWLGFDREIAAEVREAIEVCTERGCADPMLVLDVAGGPDRPAPDTDRDGLATASDGAAPDDEGVREPGAPTSVRVPFIGTVELARSGVLASTALIAFVDGFNPCSLWVLSILLALLVRTGSRARLAIVGGTFLGVTAMIYGLFIAGAFGTLAYVGHLGWLRGVVAAFALVFAAVSIKDYLSLKRGPSFTIPDAAKPQIFRRSRRIADADSSLSAVVAATIVMATGVALIELPCTAGFPIVWSQIVHDAGVAGAGFAGLLGVYLGIYLLDEVVVLAAVVVTMQVSKVQERHVQALKLVGGTIMLCLGVAMLLRPELLHDLTGTLVVFLSATAVAMLVHTTRRLVTR